jgi:hypothetical protein
MNMLNSLIIIVKDCWLPVAILRLYTPLSPKFICKLVCAYFRLPYTLLELISTDLVIRTKFISHALIGGVFLYCHAGSGLPLHSAYK